MTNNPKSKNTLLIFLLILSIGFVIGAYYYSQVAPKSTQETEQPKEEENVTSENLPESEEMVVSDVSPTVTPTPRPLPHGKRTFVVSLPTNVKGPRIGKGTIDPYDPALNGKQTLAIEVNDTVPVQSVVAILKTDNNTKEFELTPTTQGQLKGNWTGTWTVDDTYLYTYTLSVRATSSNGISTADLTTR